MPLLVLLLLAPDREPGLVDPAIVRVEAWAPARREGTAADALDAFLRAHEAHGKGEEDAALAGYLAFLETGGAG
ncbi:MAG: hypothetical protein ACREID_00925, partial [Planctomycetota bacterium]